MKVSHLPLSLLALMIAAPVLAAEPAATSGTHPSNPAMPAATQGIAPQAATVDINSASATDLKALPGITEADAAKIVQGRPFKEPSDLVTKKILSDAEFAKVKDRLVVGHPKS